VAAADPGPHGARPAGRAPMAAAIGRAVSGWREEDVSREAVDKVKTCLFDLIGCAFESRDLPWSGQARSVAAFARPGEGATLFGEAAEVVPGDAAFANAVMGHGLVREDMHSGSISHLGIVVLPALLALVETAPATGARFAAAVVAGYEVGGRFGRIAMDAEVAKIHRPTGVTGPVGAAAAGARLLGLSAEETTMAIAVAANAVAGFNQWAHTGGSEMWFEAGLAARNALTAVGLARAGAFASPSALDGRAGLLAALGKAAPASGIALFDGPPEILSVYHKPVPACNFAQTPSQAALEIGRGAPFDPASIGAIRVRVPRAGKLYPGCDSVGPFEHVLQAKMSIQYNVAAALLHGKVDERNFDRLDDPALARLVGVTTLEIDEGMTAAYPGLQGAAVEVRFRDGTLREARLRDVVNATVAEVRTRFRTSVTEALGPGRAAEIEACIDSLITLPDAGAIARLLRTAAPARGNAAAAR